MKTNLTHKNQGGLMPFFINLIFLFLPFLIMSCQSNSIVGKWVYEESDGRNSFKLVCEFFKDKTFLQTTYRNGNAVDNKNDGDYSQEGDEVILKPRFADVIRLKIKNDKLLFPMQIGGGYLPLRTIDIPLSRTK